MEELEAEVRIAAQYLRNHDYGIALYLMRHDIKIDRLLYEGGKGDGTWEQKKAEATGWIRNEKGTCCFNEEQRDPSALYCSTCKTGINKMVSWTRGYEPEQEKKGFFRGLLAKILNLYRSIPRSFKRE